MELFHFLSSNNESRGKWWLVLIHLMKGEHETSAILLALSLQP